MSFERIGRGVKLPELLERDIRAAILSGELAEGQALPTEPELSRRYGVSRSVVRDAIRLLIAKGLVEIRRGRGTYVRAARGEAFAEALLLALSRKGGTALDIEEFYGLLLPGIAELCAERASGEERERMLRGAEAYLEAFGREALTPTEGGPELLRELFEDFMHGLLKASGNRLAELVGGILVRMRSFRDVELSEGEGDGKARGGIAALIELEERAVMGLARAVAGGRAADARAGAARLCELRPALRARLAATPAGEMPTLSFDMLVPIVQDS
jgi:DNA-binding FadR family transcriptional regulator